MPRPDMPKVEIRAEEREGAVKRERERESGSEGGRLRGSVGPPQRERWLPSLKSSPASCPAPQLLPTLPQAAAGGSAIPAPAKAGKGGKGTGVRCTTGLPGPSTTRATTAATRPGAGRLRRPWVRALVRLEYPSSSGTWGEGPNRAQGCPPPRLLFSEALGRVPGCNCWETCPD